MSNTPLMTTLNSSMTWVLRLVLAVLVVMIFATALGIVTQTQERHEAYIELQKRSRELNELKIEEQRLMIEQQHSVPRRKLLSVPSVSLECFSDQ